MTELRPIGKIESRVKAKEPKREVKKRQLADSAIEALKRFGYANTTLRDIAAQSDMSLGMLNYYFESKEQLLIYCVRRYKEEFVDTVARAVRGADGREGAVAAFADALAGSIVEDAETHGLWYDIRSQALFDRTFAPLVEELEASLAALVRPFARDPDDPDEVGVLYGAVDGVFRHLLHRQILGSPRSREELKRILIGFMS